MMPTHPALSALGDSLNRVGSVPDLDGVFGRVLTEVARHVRTHDALLWLNDMSAGVSRLYMVHQGGWSQSAASAGHPEARNPLPLDEFMPNWRVDLVRQVPQVFDRLTTDRRLGWTHRDRLDRLGIRSLVLLPLTHEGVTLGAISVRLADPKRFTQHELDTAYMLAQQATLALQLFSLIERTKHEAVQAERARLVRDMLALIEQPTVAASIIPATELPILTARERDVLSAIVAGKSNKQIARSLSISEATVKTHTQHIYAKLGVEDRTQAATYALRTHLLG